MKIYVKNGNLETKDKIQEFKEKVELLDDLIGDNAVLELTVLNLKNNKVGINVDYKNDIMKSKYQITDISEENAIDDCVNNLVDEIDVQKDILNQLSALNENDKLNLMIIYLMYLGKNDLDISFKEFSLDLYEIFDTYMMCLEKGIIKDRDEDEEFKELDDRTSEA